MSEEFDIEADVASAEQITRLRQTCNRLSRELFEVKHKHADYIAAVEGAVRDAVGTIQVAPVPAPIFAGGTDGEEVAVALLSDLQTGKRTPDYDSGVARDRVMRYAQKIVELADIQRLHHPVRRVVVPMLGDMVEGVNIFPGQEWLIDSTLYTQVFNTTPVILADFLRYLAANFETVEVHAVQGNHGRLGRNGQFGPEDNADKMVYRITELLLRDEPRVTFDIADPSGERAWFKIMDVGAWRAMLIHGDQIRGHSGFPWYGLGKKVNAWASGEAGVPQFKDLLMGHWHQLARIPLNSKSVWVNGSTESTNTYASESLAAQSEPSQWLLFVDPNAGRVTASYGVDLR
jgi:hypothetical protein